MLISSASLASYFRRFRSWPTAAAGAAEDMENNMVQVKSSQEFARRHNERSLIAVWRRPALWLRRATRRQPSSEGGARRAGKRELRSSAS